MDITDINEKEFDSQVTKSSVPVIIDIWAEWCGPCRMFSPIFEEVARDKDLDGKVKFMKLDADQNEALMSKFNIMSIPTTLLIEHGEIKAMNVGAVSKDALKKWIVKNL
ncbi:MAG: thioredoxin [Candidatus Micrarchaeota archaeon]|nr:thioredoxin [Candidatus Micrarchaeota archaeon]